MKINSYSFGKIVINRIIYTKDVIILPDRVIYPWWRKEGHLLQWEDIEDVLKEAPQLLIIGKGYSGLMQVPESLIKRLNEKGIKVLIGNTAEMVKIFNSAEEKNKIAALHLTC